MANIDKNGTFMALPMNIKRGNPIPIDTTSIWYNYDDMVEYAVNGVTSYVGQILTFVDEENEISKIYVISNEDGDLKELGSASSADELSLQLSNLSDDIDNIKDSIGTIPTVGGQEQTIVDFINSTKQEILGSEVLDSTLDTIKEISDWIKNDTTNASTLISQVNAIKNDYLTSSDLTDITTKLNTIDTNAQVNVIDSVDTNQFSIDANKNLTLLSIAMSKVTGLPDALNSKVDKEEGKSLVLNTDIEKLGTIIYDNINDGYYFSGTIDASNVEGLDTLLDGVDNVIEAVKINGTALTVNNKEVNIPIAGNSQLGVVLSSSANNKISIANDGTMEVNSLNINKLTQTNEDELVLDGGNA